MHQLPGFVELAVISFVTLGQVALVLFIINQIKALFKH